ncbi:MAG: chemotaxis protein [Gammaproteobacteria bacterium]|nr:MAG: chemotaxis protein [Gammaproteobacteria bacterium]
MNAANTTSIGDIESRSGSGIIVLLVLAILLMAANVGYGVYQGQLDQRRAQISAEMRVLSQQIASSASEAVKGNPDAFRLLSDSTRRFRARLQELELARGGLFGIPMSIVQSELAELQATWKKVGTAADEIYSAKDTVLGLHKLAAELEQKIPQLQNNYNLVIDILLETNVNRTVVWLATRQIWFAERIIRSLQKVLVTGGEEAQRVAESFGHDVDVFGQVLNGMLEGDPIQGFEPIKNQEAREALQDILSIYNEVKDNVANIIDAKDVLLKVHAANAVVFENATKLAQDAEKLENAFLALPNTRLYGNVYVSAGLFGVVILLLFIMYLQQRRADRRRAQLAAEARDRERAQNERNQQAIIRLLDEMEGLADGDLTVHATVTEDFTGAIADAMNYTIDQLRSLVATIKQAVVRVSAAAEETQATATELTQAAKNQAQEITGASAAINEMAVSIEQVSANAAESAQVAEKSVEIAHKGAAVVRNTIKGMDTIREQIQETSKRIKRLGESSQEIGDIVALINDISDQTNILALNASIQASMAGDAGRGFAVVADEVQRLAERSSNATKQIEALVKTIQTDTNEAVISMEASTAEVVRGAQLAHDAGVALEEIENVSRDLADLIQNISNAARQQAASAGHVSNTMNVIQEITNQTLAGVQATAVSIGKLAELADELRETVAGFKLPESEDVETDDTEEDFDLEFGAEDEDVTSESESVGE